ncbi:glycoside hydrolase family 65 protein [Actinopolymorpha singaporensis]|uniref:Trehalose and maltose hydrolase (Possible phosphorylase) n=1 Tax=Actinopolymorpha singaporensis TaxID=117157 RepID=A0A1H1VUC0_9ACTN|nr:glycosyl hydrolase family 65 protein [Actinopolymorpha singaporensis]SDS88051.1 Trehalose and maltose hydrolase (possible phosphorylase) [Actinopolymorpha singaporensis]
MSHSVLTYDGYDPAREGSREALCTLGNGYVGTRGAAPESHADGVHYPGTYLAGCYDRLESCVAGRVVENEDLVNAPNWLPLTFRRVDGRADGRGGGPDGEWFDLDRVQVLDFRQELDIGRGVLTRRVRFRDDGGRTTQLAQRRWVSMDDPHLAVLETVVEPEDWSGRLQVRAALDGTVANRGVRRYADLAGDHLRPVTGGYDGQDLLWLQVETAQSRVRIAEAARVRVHGAAEGPVERRYDARPRWVGLDLTFAVERGVPVTVEKTVAIHTSRDRATTESLTAACDAASRAARPEHLLARHELAWSRLWRGCRTVVDGGPQQTLDLCVFHLLQTLSEHTVELDVGAPARGLHGEAYRGHVFWDELFVFPFLLLRLPEVARALLMYRWRRLPQARLGARGAGHRGAMYPWQSGSDGRDETQRLHLNPLSGHWVPDNTHLQHHVGLAVAYNVWKYYEATGDVSFLVGHGAEMLVEIARFWSGLATYEPISGRYEIRGVMGPDEYHDAYPGATRPGIDNNSYTNVMAAWTLRRALDALAAIPAYQRTELTARLGLRHAELDRFEEVSRRLRVVFHDGIIGQFEGYDQLAELDWAGYRAKYGDIRRLDRILEAEGDSVRRYQVSKQADVLMLFFLLGKDELTQVLNQLGYDLDPATILRTIEYYLDRTSHGSTLSAVVHAWVLARTDRHGSWAFFLQALGSDVRGGEQGTTAEGVHLGAMAGCADLLQRCYTGIETRDDVLRLNPRLPRELTELELQLRYRGHWGITVHCTQDEVRIGLRRSAAAPITVAVKDEHTTLRPGRSWWVRHPRAPSHGAPGRRPSGAAAPPPAAAASEAAGRRPDGRTSG